MYKASSAFVSTQIKFCSPILSAKKSCFPGWKGKKALWSQLDKSSKWAIFHDQLAERQNFNVSLPPRKLDRNLDCGMVRQFISKIIAYNKLLIAFSRSLLEIEVVAISDWHCGYKPMWVLKESVELENTWLYTCVPRYFNCPLQNWPDSSRSQDDQGIKAVGRVTFLFPDLLVSRKCQSGSASRVWK